MKPVTIVLLAIATLVTLWLAYRIGMVVLRVLAGLCFFAVAGFAVWYFLLRPHPSF